MLDPHDHSQTSSPTPSSPALLQTPPNNPGCIQTSILAELETNRRFLSNQTKTRSEDHPVAPSRENPNKTVSVRRVTVGSATSGVKTTRMTSSERLQHILSPPRRDVAQLNSLVSPPLSPPPRVRTPSPPPAQQNIVPGEGLKKWAIQYKKNKSSNSIHGTLCSSAIQQRSRHIQEEAPTRPWALKYRDLRANKRPSKVFGVQIAQVVASEVAASDGDSESAPLSLPPPRAVLVQTPLIPRIVRRLVTALNPKLDTEGLFRVAGNQTSMSHLCNEFDCYFEVDLGSYDGHCLAGVLKQYLRDLPQPLFPYEQYTNYFAIQGGEFVARAVLFGNLINELPLHNKAVLLYLLDFFIRVTEASHINKMTPNNLAIVLGPTLLPSINKDPLQVLSHNMSSVQLVEDLITHGPIIFEYLSSTHTASSSVEGVQ